MKGFKPTKVYISGPMSGYPEHNFPAFDRAAAALRASGYDVFNPAENEPPAGGHDESAYSYYMRFDLNAVLDADFIYALDGWERSKGSRLEIELAHLIGIPVFLNGNTFIETVPLFTGWAGHPTYYALLENAARIHAKKNQDYGGQGGDPLSNFKDAAKLGVTPFDGCLVRMSDKFARICNLNRKEKVGEGAAVADESIEDTLLDLVNYALLAICLRRERDDVQG